VVDRYRYWSVDAIVADLDERRHPFHVAVENWTSDLNIGTVVRNANAFLAASVVIVGRRQWNRRGAMVTDRYQHVRHVASVDELVTWASAEALPIARTAATMVCSIAQFGSTRSINAGVASGIAMHTWIRQHA
jgi:tRNA G18 (ribose-2'-O)-methylase SpoU